MALPGAEGRQVTRAFVSTTRQRVELVPVGDLPQDEHAICPCGGLMAYTAIGVLVCADCNVQAQAEPKPYPSAGRAGVGTVLRRGRWT